MNPIDIALREAQTTIAYLHVRLANMALELEAEREKLAEHEKEPPCNPD